MEVLGVVGVVEVEVLGDRLCCGQVAHTRPRIRPIFCLFFLGCTLRVKKRINVLAT